MEILDIAAAIKKSKAYTDAKVGAITTNMTYKGSVSSKNDLPLTNNHLGDVYTVSNENGQEYVWSIQASSGTIDKWEMFGGSGITYEEV